MSIGMLRPRRALQAGCWGLQPMDFDPVLLARLQFAFTIAFHIIFPSFTIGLSAYIATLHVTAWLHRPRPLPADRPVLDQDFRGVVRHGRGFGRRAVLRARHQLEPVLACRRQHHRPARRLRGAQRVFPGGELPRHPAVRRQTRAALAACAVGGDRRGRHRDVGVLDPVRQQLDAHAGRPRDARRHRLSRSTGGRSCSTRASPIASRTCSTPPTSPRASSCWRSARATCSRASTSRRRAP